MKKITLLIALALITISGTLAFATISYVLDKTVEQDITVGQTAQYEDGIIIELLTYDDYDLTYFTLEETITQKHYITYTYSYEILISGMEIDVTSLSDSIVISEIVITDTTIAITVSLNQEMEFNEGDVLNIQFYFEAVEQIAININDSTLDELMNIGFSESEATEIVALEHDVVSLDDLYYYIYIADIHNRFDQLVLDGIIVFN